ncbi:MAG: hemolysin family protein [Victivallis sp.]
MMVDIGEENGAIESDEKRMIENVFEFNNTTAAEVMTHRTELVALEIDTPPDEVERVLLSCGFSRVPVYRNDIDDIVGMLHFREYLSAKLKGEAAPDIRKLLKPVYFAPGTMRANILFRNMQSRKFGMAVILDEFGGTSGIVSVEDLLEEIVGSLYDEYDEPEVEIEEVAENEWRIGGSMRLDEIARKLDILLPEEEYDTIGGLVFGELNAIPTVGAVVELPEAGVTIRVVSVDERRVEQVLLTRQPRTAEEEAEEE